MWQTTPGTAGSSKSLTQTLSLGESRLKVVLMQPISSARAAPIAARSSSAVIESNLIAFLFLSEKKGLHHRDTEEEGLCPSGTASHLVVSRPCLGRSQLFFSVSLCLCGALGGRRWLRRRARPHPEPAHEQPEGDRHVQQIPGDAVEEGRAIGGGQVVDHPGH